MCIKYRALFNDHVDIQHSPHDGLPDQTGISIKSGGVQLLLLLHSTLKKNYNHMLYHRYMLE